MFSSPHGALHCKTGAGQEGRGLSRAGLGHAVDNMGGGVATAHGVWRRRSGWASSTARELEVLHPPALVSRHCLHSLRTGGRGVTRYTGVRALPTRWFPFARLEPPPSPTFFCVPGGWSLTTTLGAVECGFRTAALISSLKSGRKHLIFNVC